MNGRALDSHLGGLSLAALTLLALASPILAQTPISGVDLGGLEWRNIGPAINSGRIADIAIHPDDPAVMYVGVGSGGVWKTVNAGTTWEPIFDDQASYSIGSVALDPSEPSTVWVGTGENHGGRHLAFGDGMYRSRDGGRTWTNMGLRESEHLSTIIVHPENSDVVWVAAQGPLWSSGGERGLYRTTDGGENWTKVLGEGEWTGVTDVAIDPRNPDRLYAATWDRHRTVASYMGGGPGSGIWKSDDGGETWREVDTGLPGSNLGKIGLAVSPQQPDIVYAAVETDLGSGGVYMSEDRGESWRRMSDAVSGGTGPHYYQELYASPHVFGRLYLVSNNTLVSDDHFATYQQINNDNKHVDDHAIAFRPDDPDYIVFGTDGGLYESFDHMANWSYVANLPLMQYYKIAVDDAEPFYNVFGGTQDNGSNGGPSRTAFDHGIRNADWFKTLGADGHDQATEMGNPDILYAESQQGNLHRVDRTTSEEIPIQPQARAGEPFERFNWDAPIEASFHQAGRIYHASYRVWRSDDRGDSWTPISGDLTRSDERLEMPILGRVQSFDNPWDMGAMSNFNTITSIGESPVDEEVIWAGTDDGLVHVTEDGGENWRRIEVSSLPGLPARAFVNDIKADFHDRGTVYIALDNHKEGDFTPYLVKSDDMGQSWESLAATLPDRHLVWRVVQDHVDPDLLFAATEFGVFVTVDGGGEWVEMDAGLPTISFRDIVIQRDHEDVVAASFGRGMFVLDDYTPLREAGEQGLTAEATLFDTRPGLLYVPKEVSEDQGANEWTAENPPFGTVFTYHLRDGYRSMADDRRRGEGDIPAGQDVPFPGYDALEAEMREQGPFVQVVVRDAGGDVVNRVGGPTSAGIHRVAWDLTHAAAGFVEAGDEDTGGDFMVTPGSYTASLVVVEEGAVRDLAGPMQFQVEHLYPGALPRVSPQLIAQFRADYQAMSNEIDRVEGLLDAQIEKVEALQTAMLRATTDDPALVTRLSETRLALLELRAQIDESEARDQVGEWGAPTPGDRLSAAEGGLETSHGPTAQHREMLEAAETELAPMRTEIERMADVVVPELEAQAVAAGAPPLGRGIG